MTRTIETVKSEFDVAVLERNELQEKLMNEGANLLESEELAAKEEAVTALRAEYMAATATARLQNDVNNTLVPTLIKHKLNVAALETLLKSNKDYCDFFKIEVAAEQAKGTRGRKPNTPSAPSPYSLDDIKLSGKSKTWEDVYNGVIPHPDYYLIEKLPMKYQVVGVKGEDGLWSGEPVPPKAVLELIREDRGEGKKPFMETTKLKKLLAKLKPGVPNPEVLDGKIVLLENPIPHGEVFKD